VYESTDGGDTWVAFGDGLAVLPVWSLAVTPDRRLLAGTSGGGVYERDIAVPAVRPRVRRLPPPAPRETGR
jgi:hypothetical protein